MTLAPILALLGFIVLLSLVIAIIGIITDAVDQHRLNKLLKEKGWKDE